MKLKPYVFTKHAIVRLEENGLDESMGQSMLSFSKYQEISSHRTNKKAQLYGFKQCDIYYMRYKRNKQRPNYPSFLFTLKDEPDRIIVITATKKEVDTTKN